MKRVIMTTISALFLLSSTAMAVDLTGTWVADNWCVPGNEPYDPTVPKYDE